MWLVAAAAGARVLRRQLAQDLPVRATDVDQVLEVLATQVTTVKMGGNKQ